MESQKARLDWASLAKFHCTTFHSVFAPNSAFAAKPAEPGTPNPGLSNAKQHRLLLLSTDAAMQASVRASVSRLVLGPEAPAHLLEPANCKFAAKHAGFRQTAKKEIERRGSGQRQQHESDPQALCITFQTTSAAPRRRC